MVAAPFRPIARRGRAVTALKRSRLPQLPTGYACVIAVAMVGATAAAAGWPTAVRAALLATGIVGAGDGLVAWQRGAVRRAIERERLLVARELHDGPAQTVAVFVHRARALATMQPAGWTADGAFELVSIGERAMIDLRGAMQSLQPAPALSIGVVIAREAADAARGGAVALDVATYGDQCVSVQHQHLLRCVTREAIGNAVRHSGAGSVEVRLQMMNNRVRLQVADDGHGFDTATIRRGAVGVASMRWRARANGGTLEIESHPGAGTVVTVAL